MSPCLFAAMHAIIKSVQVYGRGNIPGAEYFADDLKDMQMPERNILR